MLTIKPIICSAPAQKTFIDKTFQKPALNFQGDIIEFKKQETSLTDKVNKKIDSYLEDTRKKNNIRDEIEFILVNGDDDTKEAVIQSFNQFGPDPDNRLSFLYFAMIVSDLLTPDSINSLKPLVNKRDPETLDFLCKAAVLGLNTNKNVETAVNLLKGPAIEGDEPTIASLEVIIGQKDSKRDLKNLCLKILWESEANGNKNAAKALKNLSKNKATLACQEDFRKR